jgi:radical SAM superfamily enzyme YgiQ (UPF0313 family)
VVGEAEAVLAEFVRAWERGDRRGVFKAEKFTVDIATSPVPQFDLLKFDQYLYVGVQFSRGCPFNCEFCDIIDCSAASRAPRAMPRCWLSCRRSTISAIAATSISSTTT